MDSHTQVASSGAVQDEWVTARRSEAEDILSMPLPACLKLSGLVSSSAVGSDRDGRGRALRQHTPSRMNSSRPVRPVYDVLLEKGRLAQEKRERMAEEAIAREIQDLRAAPRLTPAFLAKQSAPSAGGSADGRIEDRLLKRAKEREAVHLHQVKVHEEKLAKQLAAVATFHPRISKRAQSTKAKVYAPPPDREAWRQQRRAELELAREKQEEKVRGAAAAFQPVVDKRSERLAQRASARSGLGESDVVDRMWAREAQRRSRQWAAFEESQTRSAKVTGRPVITSRAAALVRQGHAGQRLYETTFDMAERQWERERAHAAEQDGDGFAPRITKPGAAATSRYLDAVWLGVGRQGSTADTEPSFHPTIDPVSAILADEREESTWERLYTSNARSSLTVLSGGASTHSDLYRPAVHPLSPRVASALETDKQRRQQWYEEQRREQEERELLECTFKPRITLNRQRSVTRPPHDGDTRTSRHSAHLTERHPVDGVEAVAARSRAWEDRRQQRLAELRAMALMNDDNESDSYRY